MPPLAEVNGEAIEPEELERAVAGKLAHLEEQIYQLKRYELDALVAQRLLAIEAKKRGVSVLDLENQEITLKAGRVTEPEIEAFYNENKASLQGAGAELRQKIRVYLQAQKVAARRDLYLELLRSQAKILIRLQPPAAARLDVKIAGAPSRGMANAAVTIVEFSDFECPFCKQAHPILIQVLEKYRGKVNLVYRDFPLDMIHPQARRAAEAARCAHEQRKFWDYHDVLFTQAPRLAPDDLKRYAREVSLDADKFDACLSSGMHKAGVQRDIDEGTRLGVTGTPAFYINGRPLQGYQPLQAFARVIDEELARIEAEREGKSRSESTP
jgi:protein-disulfide isomerase